MGLSNTASHSTANETTATNDTMKTATTTEPRLYVGTYAKYNAGNLNGGWLDLSDYTGRDSFLEACQELHSDESDPELMFQDFEGFPRCWYSESSAPDDILWEWLELSENEREAFGLYADHIGGDCTVDDFRDAYSGTANSEADFCENMAIECDAVSPDNANWIVIDWEATWNCNLRFDYFSERGESGDLHFFRNC